MANTYCTATNFGKGFFTHEDRNDFYLSGHAGDVWVVGNNAAGVSWINRVSGTGKTAAEAQAIVDGKIEEGQAAWDALPEAEKAPPPSRKKEGEDAADVVAVHRRGRAQGAHDRAGRAAIGRVAAPGEGRRPN